MQRFVRAMKTVLPLRHPNLVTLYGAGKTGPYCWAAMEYVEGESMKQVIQRVGVAGMLDWRYGYRVAVHIARALDHAHGQTIIHRNVTPTNILFRTADKTAQLGDLMLAKALEGNLAQQITRPGELVGDVAYMSPEADADRGGSGRAFRPVRAGGDAVRPAGRPSAVRGRPDRDDRQDPSDRACQTDQVPDGDPAPIGGSGVEADGHGPGRPLPVRQGAARRAGAHRQDARRHGMRRGAAKRGERAEASNADAAGPITRASYLSADAARPANRGGGVFPLHRT